MSQPAPKKFKNPRAKFNFQGRTCSVVGVGSYLPERILTNAELEKLVDTTDEWITTRTGIKERRIAAKNHVYYSAHGFSNLITVPFLLTGKNPNPSARRKDFVLRSSIRTIALPNRSIKSFT